MRAVEARPHGGGGTGAPGGRSPAYLCGSILALVGVMLGFSFTFFRPLLAGMPFAAFVQLHAWLWFGWFALFVAQALPVAARSSSCGSSGSRSR